MLVRHNPYLTPGFAAELAENIRKTHSGQAHWGGSGPPGKTCAGCAHWGYVKLIRNSAGNAVREKKTLACARFRELTGKHGPPVPAAAHACKYFAAKRQGV